MATSTPGAATDAVRKRLDPVGSTQVATPPIDRAPGDYVVPFVHTRIPAPLVQLGFWGGLAGTVAFGLIDFPLAAAVGAGVVVARHRRGR